VDVRAGGREAAKPAVLVIHGFKGFKDWGMFPPFAERLARAGFAAVSFNVSGSGVDAAGDFSYPERFGHNTWSAELADVTTVLDALAGGHLGLVPPSSIGALGHSRGGGVAVLLAARDERVRALVTWAAVSTVQRWDEAAVRAWRAAGRQDVVNARTGQVLPLYTDILDDMAQHGDALDIPAAAARLTIPWLIVHGEVDEAVPLAEGEALARAAPSATSRFERIPGGGHTFGARHPWAGSTAELDRAMAQSVAWLARFLA
jgi:dienelactone hydrolase